jgi:hypothetical protein
MRAILSITAIVGVVAIAAPTAHAQKSAKERAQELLVEGVGLYEGGDRVGAVKKFEEAYGVFPSPKILYNLGRAYRDVGRNAQAHQSLSRFLREVQSVAQDRRTEVEEWLADLEKLVGLLVIATDVSAVTITVDGTVVGTTPLGGPIAVAPGVHTVAARRDGTELDSQQVAAYASTSTDVALEIKEPVAKVPSPAEAAGRVAINSRPGADPLPPQRDDDEATPVYKKAWFWGVVVGVAAASTAAIVFAGGGDTVNDINPSLGEFDFGDF